MLIALAVLLLPLWLDGEGLRHTLNVASIPEEPELPEVQISGVPKPKAEDLALIEDPPEVMPVPEEITGAEPEPAPAPRQPEPEQPEVTVADEPASQEAPPAADSSSETEDRSDTKPAAEQSEPESRPEPSAPAQREESPPVDGERWVVQLGSFSDELNARGLRERVREAGFNAYVEPLFAEQGTVWRVRVGPFASRAAADDQRARLRERLNRDGMVVRD
ncbi:MAG: SPOR domain-containing protein [Halothiobacillaceae bacterium]